MPEDKRICGFAVMRPYDRRVVELDLCIKEKCEFWSKRIAYEPIFNPDIPTPRLRIIKEGCCFRLMAEKE